MYTDEKIQKIMKTAEEMKKKMKEIQEDICATEIIGKSGAGSVTIFMNGNYTCKYIEINNEIWNEKNKELLQDLITSAINDAVQKIIKLQKKKFPLNPELIDLYQK